MERNIEYKQKYLKYKQKYLDLQKSMKGGVITSDDYKVMKLSQVKGFLSEESFSFSEKIQLIDFLIKTLNGKVQHNNLSNEQIENILNGFNFDSAKKKHLNNLNDINYKINNMENELGEFSRRLTRAIRAIEELSDVETERNLEILEKEKNNKTDNEEEDNKKENENNKSGKTFKFRFSPLYDIDKKKEFIINSSNNNPTFEEVLKLIKDQYINSYRFDFIVELDTFRYYESVNDSIYFDLTKEVDTFKIIDDYINIYYNS